MVLRGIAAALIAAATLTAAAITPVDAQARRVQVGTLACSISAGVGVLVGSQRNVACNFQPDNGPPEAYTGTMTRVGVDVGFTTAARWSGACSPTRVATPGC